MPGSEQLRDVTRPVRTKCSAFISTWRGRVPKYFLADSDGEGECMVVSMSAEIVWRGWRFANSHRGYPDFAARERAVRLKQNTVNSPRRPGHSGVLSVKPVKAAR